MMSDAREETKAFNREAKVGTVKSVTLTTQEGMVHNIDTSMLKEDDEIYYREDNRLTNIGIGGGSIEIDLVFDENDDAWKDLSRRGREAINRALCQYEGADVQIRQVKDAYAPVAVFKRSGYNHIGIWRENGFYEAMGRAREMLMQVHAGKIRPIINNQR